MTEIIEVRTRGQGLYEITDQIVPLVRQGSVAHGLCTIFVMHTSASLTIQENADPSARHDLEEWFCRLVAEDDPNFTHTAEGPDDMPSHIKAALTDVSVSIPILQGALTLGTWQGIHLWEHRRSAHTRRISVSIIAA